MRNCLNPGLAAPINDLSRSTDEPVLPPYPSSVVPVSLTAPSGAFISAGYPAGTGEKAASSAAGFVELPAAIREKLKLLSFVTIVIVIFNHAVPYSLAYGAVEIRQPSALVEFLCRLWAVSFGRVSLMIFFLIAGYLFFWTLKPELSGFVEKWKKRLRSLVMPYLIWSVIGFAGFMLLYGMDGTRQLVGRRSSIAEGDWTQMLRTILWSPVPYQFWYVRDLCALILMSPLIYVAARFLGWWLGVAMAACWFAGILPSWPDQSGLTFFTLGAVLATRRVVPDWNLRPWLLPSLALWVSASVVNTVLHPLGNPVPWINKVVNIAWLVALWALLDLIRGRARERMVQAATFTFFVFAAHEPLMGAMRKVVFKFVPFNGVNSMVGFFLLPVVTLAICLVVGAMLRRRSPAVFRMLTGGRCQ